MRWILALLFLAPLSAPAATPFANNLYGLKYVVLDVTGDAAAAKKAGYPFDVIRKDLKAALEKAGLKVVRSGKEVPEDKKALPMELMLGMVNQKSLYSYALSLQAYEPMRIDDGDRLYVAWTNLLYGFGTQASVKSQLKEQTGALASAFVADLKHAKRR
jgi:hypothetical protein